MAIKRTKAGVAVGVVTIAAATGWIAAAEAKFPPDSLQLAELAEIQAHLLNENFTLVDSLCIELTARRPSDPLGYLFRAATLWAEMVDQEEILRPKLFESWLDTAESLAHQSFDSSSEQAAAWCCLVLGNVQVYRSLFASRFGSMISAYRHGVHAARAYERGLALDSTLYDLYAGLGSFHYWKSADVGLLRWFGIIRDDRELGRNEVRLAADSAVVTAEAARQSLVAIWLHSGQYDSAIHMANEMHARYPNADAYFWALARAHLGQGNDREAVAYFSDLRERIAKAPVNYYNLIQCDWQITCCWERLGQGDLARASASRLVEYAREVPAKTRRKQQHRMAHLRRLSASF